MLLDSIPDWLVDKPLNIAVIILIALVLRGLVHRAIKRVVNRPEGGLMPEDDGKRGGKRGRPIRGANPRQAQRMRTVGSLLKSISTMVIGIVAITMVLAEVGLNIGPIIASAGIVGVAVGFGAQTLVKDLLSGIFMIVEDQYGVGDFVDTGDAMGEVEAVSLRVTRMRGVDGTVWYVRNGEILRVGNMSQDWARTVLDISVAYDADVAAIRATLQEVGAELAADPAWSSVILDPPEVWGVQDLGTDVISIRVVARTAPQQQWAVGREFRERIKSRFDNDGVVFPFPQRVVWHREPASIERDGQ